MLAKDAIVLLIIIFGVLVTVFFYMLTMWLLDRTRGEKCRTCKVRGFVRHDPLLGRICGNCERIKALSAGPEEDWLTRLRSSREQVPLRSNPRLDDYPLKGSKNHPSTRLDTDHR